MKKTDLSHLSTKDLQEKVSEERKSLGKMKFGHSISPVENSSRMRASRKEIARMLTELRKRDLSEAK